MNSRYDNSLTKYADGMAISYTYKMTGLDHTILNRSKYGLLSDSEKEEIMCNLAENYFMSYKGLRSYDRWGRQTTTGLFEREGKEFVFVPGDKITIGWDAFAEGFDSFNYKDVQSILSECEYEGSVESYLREVMMPVKEVQVAPMLVCRNLQMVCWEPIPIDSPEIQGNKNLMSELSECEASGCDEYTVHKQIKFVRGNDGWSVFLYRPMSYPDLKEQLARQGFSLPTANEWAYLCGGGCRTIFPFGDNLDLDTMHLCYIDEPGDKRPYYMKEPNFFGLSIGYDPYMDELIDAKQKSNCGGDGGCNFCGGMGIVIPFLPCSPHYKPITIYPEDNEELDGDYDFYRPIIRIK
ncbi:MAG: hypothetical protein HFJ56_19980 [Bacteroides xylanisolvens]|jgi:hypothetical protein|nr:hypothetical protein [Bacteroides xylanisolvens]